MTFVTILDALVLVISVLIPKVYGGSAKGEIWI
jgi:hypothetical protein